MKLPEDPMMLYSFINMKLRDFYPSLDRSEEHTSELQSH